jgi:hypothetical protein
MTDPRSDDLRDIHVDDPALSPRANEILTAELREAARAERAPAAAVAAAGGDLGAARSAARGRLAPTRYLAAIVLGAGAVGAVVILIAVTGTDEGLWALVPLALMAGGLAALLAWAVRSTTDVESPSPSHRAQLEEEGVADPDRELTERLHRLAGGRPGDRSIGDHPREVTPDADPATAALEQQRAWTPGSDPSRPAGG